MAKNYDNLLDYADSVIGNNTYRINSGEDLVTDTSEMGSEWDGYDSDESINTIDPVQGGQSSQPTPVHEQESDDEDLIHFRNPDIENEEFHGENEESNDEDVKWRTTNSRLVKLRNGAILIASTM